MLACPNCKREVPLDFDEYVATWKHVNYSEAARKRERQRKLKRAA